MIQPTEIPPMPEIGTRLQRVTEDTENSWKASNIAFPLIIQSTRIPLRPIGITGAMQSSPFRVGEARLNTAGIQLVGTAVQSQTYLNLLMLCACLLGVGNNQIIKHIPHAAKWLDGLLLIIAICVYAISYLYSEYPRVPIDSRIAWDNVIELQVESYSRWAVLVYRGVATESQKVDRIYSINITNSQPGLVEALTEELGRYVPDRIRRDISSFEWPPSFQIPAKVFAVTVLVGIAVVLYLILR